MCVCQTKRQIFYILSLCVSARLGLLLLCTACSVGVFLFCALCDRVVQYVCVHIIVLVCSMKVNACCYHQA